MRVFHRLSVSLFIVFKKSVEISRYCCGCFYLFPSVLLVFTSDVFEVLLLVNVHRGLYVS